MDHQKAKLKQQLRRRHHVRRSIVGTGERPRLTVFRSSKHIYAQLIDDHAGVTLASASSNLKELRTSLPYGGNIKAAVEVGKKLAEAAKEKGITKAAFDRGHYRFHGRISALAFAATANGLVCTGAPPSPSDQKESAEKPEPVAKAPAKPKKPK